MMPEAVCSLFGARNTRVLANTEVPIYYVVYAHSLTIVYVTLNTCMGQNIPQPKNVVKYDNN